jgi:phosphoadenosine phosphosulfate reductase
LVDFSYLETALAPDLLTWAIAEYGSSFAIATSFQREGMVIIDIASRIIPNPRVFTLDTGRLPQETYLMIDTVRERYGIATEIVAPDPVELERMVAESGPNLFYASVEGRHTCCEVRKVHPLERKLRELNAWATGIRREQSDTRAATPKAELVNGCVKINPLADWTASQVSEYIRRHSVPVHPLYAQGYTSIGCAPCTRPIQIGESERAGRWWWEATEKKECGIHFGPDGTVRRAS